MALALAPCRNREAALALAVFLGRFWSTPSRVLAAFPIDRRAIAERSDLELTEAQVRGAIRALERVGFLDRALAKGSPYQRTATGGLHRKPVLFMFGSDYGPLFIAANKRAAAARGRRADPARSTASGVARQPFTTPPAARPLNSPKNKSSEAEKVLMGEQRPSSPARPEPNPALNAALERWRRAAEGRWSA